MGERHKEKEKIWEFFILDQFTLFHRKKTFQSLFVSLAYLYVDFLYLCVFVTNLCI